MSSLVSSDSSIELNGYNAFIGTGLTGYGYVGLYRLYNNNDRKHISFGGFMYLSGTTSTDDKANATCEMWYR